jgi:hypothetical protein
MNYLVQQPILGSDRYTALWCTAGIKKGDETIQALLKLLAVFEREKLDVIVERSKEWTDLETVS